MGAVLSGWTGNRHMGRSAAPVCQLRDAPIRCSQESRMSSAGGPAGSHEFASAWDPASCPGQPGQGGRDGVRQQIRMCSSPSSCQADRRRGELTAALAAARSATRRSGRPRAVSRVTSGRCPAIRPARPAPAGGRRRRNPGLGRGSSPGSRGLTHVSCALTDVPAWSTVSGQGPRTSGTHSHSSSTKFRL